MKETNLVQLPSKWWRSKSVTVLICFVALMLVGLASAHAQTATVDQNTGLITLDDLQPFPSDGEFSVDISEMNFPSTGEASAYFNHYNASKFFTLEVLSTDEAKLTVHYQLPADRPLPYAYWNTQLEVINGKNPN